MRSLYRERRHTCGDYLDIDIYPVFKESYKNGRSKKAKPTSETMRRYNQRCRELRLERLIMANFTQGEAVFWNPSYKDEFLPADEAEAKKKLRNFFNRLKRYRKSKGLPDLKYIVVTEKGKRNGRIHHHLILNCADMTTGPAGENFTMQERLDEIGLRYGQNSAAYIKTKEEIKILQQDKRYTLIFSTDTL